MHIYIIMHKYTFAKNSYTLYLLDTHFTIATECQRLSLRSLRGDTKLYEPMSNLTRV